MEGTVIKYTQKNINTDLIIPARYLNKSDPEHLAEHCMEDLDPDFNNKKNELGASILVGGPNFGSGSSREQAPIALKAAGIECVIAPSFARIFFRNAINIALPVIEFSEIDKFDSGDTLQIELDKGILTNKTTGEDFKIREMPDFIQDIISENGLVNFAKKKLAEN
jgi:3-isopropylmalate/(R)-2-methylmalate dehydratase small subunit